MRYRKFITATLVVVSLSACTATTSFQSKESGLHVTVNDNPPTAVDNSTSQTYSTTSFGQYKFKATRPGEMPMYGVMPLKFNGGYLAADILLFAPAAFFNLREVFPYYQFDTQEGVIRYKKEENDDWVTYKPTAAETAHAKTYFGE